MRLSSKDGHLGRPLSESLGAFRESSIEIRQQQPEDPDKGALLAAEFARARAEGYSAGMDDAAVELDEQRAQLAEEERKRRAELMESQKADRQQVSQTLHGLQQAISHATTIVEPVALELALLIIDKVLTQRIESNALARDVIQAAAAVITAPPLKLRVGTGLAQYVSELPSDVVVDVSLGVFECVVESAMGGTCISPGRRLRDIVDPLLARLEARSV